MSIQVIRSDGSRVIDDRASNARCSVGAPIYVDNLNGNDTYGDGSAGRPFRTLTRGFQDKPMSPTWIVTNPAFRVNATTGNDGTAGRYNGIAFQTLQGAQSSGAYVQGDIIYVEAGTFNDNTNLGGRDFFFEEGTLFTNNNTAHTFVSSSFTNRDYAIAGRLAITLSSTTCRLVYHDTAFTGYFQFKSVSVPVSYSSNLIECTGGTSANQTNIWIDSNLDRSNGANNTGSICYTTAGRAELRLREINSNGNHTFRATSSGDIIIYTDGVSATGSNACILSVESSGNGFLYSRGNLLATNSVAKNTSGFNANITVYCSGNITSTNSHTFICYGTGLVLIECAGTVSNTAGSQYCGYVVDIAAKMDITAKYIDHTVPAEVALRTTAGAGGYLKVRNADVRGIGNAPLGPIVVASNSVLEIYDSIIRSAAASPRASVCESAAGAGAVTWFGSNQISDAVNANIVETNTGNRTINSGLRY